MDFKDKVLMARVKLNLSQSELAQKLNVAFSTISRWETGKTQPTRKDLMTFEQFCLENRLNFDKNPMKNNIEED